MSHLEKAAELKNQGNTAFQNKEFDKALDLFTQAIDLNPNDHIFWSNRSGVYASLGKYEEALEDAKMCVSLKPDWAKGYARKGLAEYYMAMYDEAEETYTKGLQLDASNAQMKEGMDQVKKAKVDEAKSAFPGGFPGGAGGFPGGAGGFPGGFGGGANNPLFTQILSGLLSNPETQGYLQDKDFMNKLMALSQDPSKLSLYMNDPKIKKAFEVMTQGMKMPKQSKDSEPTQTSSTGKMDEENPWKEEEIDPKPEPVHKEEPKPKQPEPKPEPKVETKPQPKTTSSGSPAEAAKAKGNEEYKKKNFDAALVHYDEAIAHEPNEVTYYNNKAACYIEMKEYEKAIAVADKAIEISKSGYYDYEKLARALARKASALASLNKIEEALDWYNQSMLEKNDPKVKEEVKRLEKLKKELDAKNYINPEIAEQHKNAGNEFFKKGDYPSAYKEYEEAIKRNPNEPKYYSNRGTCLMKLMEFPSALKDIDRAIEMDPKFIKCYAKKAAIHKGLKELHKALEACEKGLKIDPEDAELKQSFAEIQREIAMGQYTQTKEEAEERYRHAMADPEIQAILMDPSVQNLLRSMQERPNDPDNMKAMRDPLMSQKLNKLIAAGVLQTK